MTQFLHVFSAAAVLIGLTIVVQSAGMAALIMWARARISRSVGSGGIGRLGIVRSAVIVVRFTSLLVCLHLLEILLWTWFYRWKCFPGWEKAFYFSATSYSTVGYGDLVLPPVWRAVGSIEALMGMLMCGVSVGLLFAIVNRLVQHEEAGS